MLEIEVKAKIDSITELEEKILKKGARFRKEVFEHDLYFNHPERDFKKTDEALRIRRVEDRSYLTYKGPKLDGITKTREEINVLVDNWESALAILRALGFTRVRSVEKKRRYFTLDNYRIMLDSLEGLGSFIEVEKKGEYDAQELLDFLKGLGIKRSETKSYLELLLEKNKK
jgi:adenylate cyclase class 2